MAQSMHMSRLEDESNMIYNAMQLDWPRCAADNFCLVLVFMYRRRPEDLSL